MPALRLRSVAGAHSGREYAFPGPRVRIGRSRANDLVLPDRESPLSSGYHAEAHQDPSGAWWIVDAGSTHGIRVNDVPIQKQQLKDGDRVVFGSDEYIVALDRRPSRAKAIAALALLAIVVGAGVLAVRWSTTGPFENTVALVGPSVFMIALDGGTGRTVVGTAFVIAADALATAAHVAEAVRQHGAAGATGSRAVAVRDSTATTFAITGVDIHPAWRAGSLRGDVALLRVDLKGEAAPPLRLADDATLAALRPGMLLAAYGFPAITTNAAAPRGRLSVDVLDAIRGDYLEIGLGIAPGMSGSPVVNDRGVVIGIVAGGDFVEGPGGKMLPTGSAANWVIRASALRELVP